MWCKKILNQLTLKVIQEERQSAIDFLEDIFYQLSILSVTEYVVQSSLEDPDGNFIPLIPKLRKNSISELLLFGLIDNMYKKFDRVEDNSIPVAAFARQLLGLSLVFMKIAEDDAIWIADFKELWRSRRVIRLLGFENQNLDSLNLIRLNFKPDENNWRPNYFEAILQDVIALERSIFSELKQSLRIDFDNLLEIYSRKENAHLLTEFLDYSQDLLLIDEGDAFSEFNKKIKDFRDFHGFFEILPRAEVICLMKGLVINARSLDPDLQNLEPYHHLSLLLTIEELETLLVELEQSMFIEPANIKSRTTVMPQLLEIKRDVPQAVESAEISDYTRNLKLFKLKDSETRGLDSSDKLSGQNEIIYCENPDISDSCIVV